MGLGFRRLKHNQGVSGPSQIRYIYYLETLLYSSIDPYQNHKVFLKTIELPVGEIQARFTHPNPKPQTPKLEPGT